MTPPPDSLYNRIGGHEGLLLFLRRFYADVRQHNEIGPIFAEHIEDWPAHLEKIAGFWSGLTGGPALYGGGLIARHIPLHLGPKHFEAWLGLWHRHCHAHLPPTEAGELIAIAESIGQRLRAITAAHG